jgi:hypothetical protein
MSVIVSSGLSERVSPLRQTPQPRAIHLPSRHLATRGTQLDGRRLARERLPNQRTLTARDLD